MSDTNEVRIVVRSTRVGDMSLRDIRNSTQHLEQDMHDASQAADRLGNDLESAGRQGAEAANHASEAMRHVGEEAHGSGGTITSALGEQAHGAMDGLSEAGGRVGEVLGKLGPYGKAAAVAIGAGILIATTALKTFMSLIQDASQRTTDLAQSKAMLGISGADAARYAKTAAKVYTDNWGESLKGAGETVRNAALYIMPTPAVMNAQIKPTLQAVSEQVQALADTMGEDSQRVSVAIRQMLLTGMASTATEAFDILHAGISAGANSADDLLDTFNEYSTQFRKLGLDGKTAMGMISQALKNGARDSDLAADAIKEFSIRSVDGSTLSAQGFKALGLDAQKMTAIFAKGGAGAQAGLDLVLSRLRAMKDPVKQAAAATALFGTQAEDLGKALFAMDPSHAVQGLGQISGAADKAANTLSGAPMSVIEAYRRKWEMFRADIGDKLVPVFNHIVSSVEKLAEKLKPFVQLVLKDMAKTWADNKDNIEKFAKFCQQVLVPFIGGVLVVAIGTIGFAFEGVVKAMATVGRAWETLKQIIAKVVTNIMNAFGMLLDSAVAAFGWIPGIGPKLKQAQKDFENFRDKVNLALDAILDKDVHVHVQVDQRGVAAPTASGTITALGHVSGRRLMAAGGYGSGWTMAGEHGPELINLGASGRVYNNGQTQRMMAGAGGATVIQLAPSGHPASGLEAMFLRWFDDQLVAGRLRARIVNGRLAPV